VARMLWTQREDIGPPPKLSFMAYDEARKVTTLLQSEDMSQTWLWDGELWVQVADIGPLLADTLVWDPTRKLLVATYNQETWEWSGSEWTQVSDQFTGEGSTAFDDRTQLLTRVTFTVALNCETWTWGDGAWTQIDDIGPPSREYFKLASDRERGVVLLVAGALIVREPAMQGFEQQPVRDAWAWNGKWKAVTDMGPSPRIEMSIAYDRDRGRVVVFGGATVPSSKDPFLNDTWEWDGKLWRQVQDMGPSRRCSTAMAYDVDRKRIVLFGGRGPNETSPTDTWEYYDHP
jgi:Galactose oxidase, central domain